MGASRQRGSPDPKMIRRRPIQQQHRSLCAELRTAQREGGAVLEHARRKLVPGRALYLGDGREFGCDDRTDCAQLFHARGGIAEELLVKPTQRSSVA
jgi:hypothetical protein